MESTRRTGVVNGFACLLRGIGFVARRPRLWALGLVPALVTFVVLTGLVVLLAVFADDLVTWATPFADGWSRTVRDDVRVLVAIALVLLAVWVEVLVFVSLTLVIGQPFYERLSRIVDEDLGNAPAGPDESWQRGARRAVGESLAVLVRTLPTGLLVFLVGLVPVVGQVLGSVLGALVGGRFLALELMAPATERRGVYLRERLALARRHRLGVYGFGVPVFVLFLVPFLSVVLMPGAVAGATLLVRELTETASRPAP
ncbi:MAG: EI24 domain-containing protein [Streptosporangiales bacterium]|nr:EI24 domain-containing protein [Streptosporangiales bacterium]